MCSFETRNTVARALLIEDSALLHSCWYFLPLQRCLCPLGIWFTYPNQWPCFSPCICSVTPEIVYFYHWTYKNKFQSIPKTVYFILKTPSLILTWCRRIACGSKNRRRMKAHRGYIQPLVFLKAEKSIRSPQKLFIFISFKHLFWVKVSKKYYI